MKTAIVVSRGLHRGRTGWVHGNPDDYNPHVTKALVHFERGAVAILALANIEKRAQLELALTPRKNKTQR